MRAVDISYAPVEVFDQLRSIVTLTAIDVWKFAYVKDLSMEVECHQDYGRRRSNVKNGPAVQDAINTDLFSKPFTAIVVFYFPPSTSARNEYVVLYYTAIHIGIIERPEDLLLVLDRIKAQ
ncbi:hypothetical protein CDL15_Pgr020815 [Punica granatum]|uniref:Uncharacterized protein n=1 Tax=Punica granatum TaxID=22663 RepID=A0A218XWH0_PUNGR|nr:hypothetical protein CDL15_Pgr020815 [Punica granatum]